MPALPEQLHHVPILNLPIGIGVVTGDTNVQPTNKLLIGENPKPIRQNQRVVLSNTLVEPRISKFLRRRPAGGELQARPVVHCLVNQELLDFVRIPRGDARPGGYLQDEYRLWCTAVS